MVSRVFLVLAIVSGVVAAVGFVWAAVAGGRSVRDQASEAGATMAAGGGLFPTGPGSGESDQGPGESDAETRRHGDRRAGTLAGSGFSFADAGRLLRAGQRRQALPGLLLGGGLLALLLFGALTLLTSLPSKWLGVAALAIAITIAIGELRGFLTTQG